MRLPTLRFLTCIMLIALAGNACNVTVHAFTVPGANPFRTVALTSRSAPGGGAFSRSFGFGRSLVDDHGRVTFSGYVGTFPEFGIWSETQPDQLALVAVEGRPAPDVSPFYQFYILQHPTINGDGVLAFHAGLIDSPLVTPSGVWRREPGQALRALVTEVGNPTAPGVEPGVYFTQFSNLLLNQSGQVAFTARLGGSGVNASNDGGLWKQTTTGELALVARKGNIAPQVIDSAQFSSFVSADLDGRGQMTFVADLAGAGVDTTNDEGLWSETSAGLQLVARKGLQAPGLEVGMVFNGGTLLDTFFPPAVNDSGDLAFLARAISNSGTSGRVSGIWGKQHDGLLELVVRTGELVPAISEEAVYTSFGIPSISATGEIAFAARMSGDQIDPTNSQGIWRTRENGGLELLARTGDLAPGAGEGMRFGSISTSLVVNEEGRTAFSAVLAETGQQGIWAEDRAGNVRLVVREGEVLEVEPGDFRTIESISSTLSSSVGNSRRGGFNRAGEFGFAARFTDGSQGVFVSNRATVPEPSTIVTLLVAMSFWKLRRRWYLRPLV
jgi:hypothetical protein